MKKVYIICNVTSKDLCIPSTDYYAKRNEWDKESITVLSFGVEFNTEEEAIESLEQYFEEQSDSKEEFTIISIYKKKE